MKGGGRRGRLEDAGRNISDEVSIEGLSDRSAIEVRRMMVPHT